jgi:ectoine hydroxylase-related dioxygenase (phytanoyl-CoA dioxygenase family)
MNGKRKYRPREDDAFLHTDQSPMKNFLWSYQGVMCLTKADQNEGGFVCIPKSHQGHHNYFKQKKLLDLKDNWYVVPEEDKRKNPLENVLKVNTEAGDFILFDSRTFHCNTVPKVDSLRVCTYICMIPS